MRREFWLCIIWLLVVASAAAQLIPVWSGGRYVWAGLDQNLKLDTSGPAPILRVLLSMKVQAPEFNLLPAAQSVFTVKCPTVLVFRNGLQQAANSDYDQSGTTITFRAASAPQGGDTVSFAYLCQ